VGEDVIPEEVGEREGNNAIMVNDSESVPSLLFNDFVEGVIENLTVG